MAPLKKVQEASQLANQLTCALTEGEGQGKIEKAIANHLVGSDLFAGVKGEQLKGNGVSNPRKT